jgi:two-component system, cell cycle response regulator
MADVHVLVCDDERGTRLVAKQLIERQFGWRVSEAGDGLEALRLLGRDQFSLVLLDIEMPNMNGLETLEEMRQSEATRHTPVVILSGMNDPQRIMPLARLGITDYMLKPIQHATTVAKLEKAMRMQPADERGGNVRLGPGAPALVVDGDQTFLLNFVKEAQEYGPVTRADCGAAALVEYRRAAVSLVFIGANLGIVSEHRLVAKMRELRGNKVRIVGIVSEQGGVADQGLFDATMKRAETPEALVAELQPFVSPPPGG